MRCVLLPELQLAYRAHHSTGTAVLTVLAAVLCGVPQGSVLGPILFLLYTADPLRLAKRHNLRPHVYANDMQIYGFFRPAAAAQIQEQISACIDEVAAWMQSNRLQLNTAKTDIIWCTSNRRQHQLPQVALRVGTDHVIPITSVRDVGIYVECDVSMRTHVSRTVSSCFAVLRRLRSIRRSVSPAVLQSLVVSLVLSVSHVWIMATPNCSR